MHSIDGGTHYVGSFMDEQVVTELDVLMNMHRFSTDFSEWLARFKEVELQSYIERDKARRASSFNVKMGNKGYCFFTPRQAWRARKRFNGKDYVLGYFKKEEACQYMMELAEMAIKHDIFREWYSDIEEYKMLVRKMFDDESGMSRLCKAKAVKAGIMKREDFLNKIPKSYSRQVEQIKDGEVIATFDNTVHAAETLFPDVKHANNSIADCCRGHRVTYKGFCWRYKGENRKRVSENIVKVSNGGTDTMIEQIENGKAIAEFRTYADAAKQFACVDGSKEISRCCRGLKKTYHGYEWRLRKCTGV